jgi:hypothetical protein
MLKTPWSTKEMLHKAKFIISFASSSQFAARWLFWQDCQRALVDESGVFLCQYHSAMVSHVHISPGGLTICPLVAAVQRCSISPSAWSSWLVSVEMCFMRTAGCIFLDSLTVKWIQKYNIIIIFASWYSH